MRRATRDMAKASQVSQSSGVINSQVLGKSKTLNQTELKLKTKDRGWGQGKNTGAVPAPGIQPECCVS